MMFTGNVFIWGEYSSVLQNKLSTSKSPRIFSKKMMKYYLGHTFNLHFLPINNYYVVI